MSAEIVSGSRKVMVLLVRFNGFTWTRSMALRGFPICGGRWRFNLTVKYEKVTGLLGFKITQTKRTVVDKSKAKNLDIQ